MHVIHRGNNRMEIFRHESDYLMLLSLLKRAVREQQVDVHGYVLMATHLHLLVTPKTPTGLSKAVQQFAAGYTRYFNRTYERIGTIWNGRCRALHLGDERYWLTCLRYIEQNPVRAGMVERPEDYRWSSYVAHALNHRHTWLAPHYLLDALGPTARTRQEAYRAIFNVPVRGHEMVLAYRSFSRPASTRGQTRV